MKFWDSSALIPLLVEEETTIPLRDLYLKEPGAIVWWSTPVECASAVSRLEREERLSAQATTGTFERLDALARHWHRIEPVDAILETAPRLLRVPSSSRSRLAPISPPAAWSTIHFAAVTDSHHVNEPFVVVHAVEDSIVADA